MVTSVYRSGYDAGYPTDWAHPLKNLLVQLNQREPEIVGHTAVAVLLRLGDTPLVCCACLVVGLDGHVALEDRSLIFLAPGLPVLVGEGKQPSRVVRVVRKQPLEII